ncbi:MAG: ABC transporter permease [Acidobacteria bacterium]|nr:ABC transporter permease [Acidobacteriota bacterium]
MDTFLQDIRYGLRTLLRSPGFTLIAVAALALGIGANTAIFSIVNTVLLRPLPYPEAERLVWFYELQPECPTCPFSAPDFLDYQSQNQTFEQMAGVRQLSFNLTGQGAAERVRGAVVSHNLFSLLRVQPVIGRNFSEDDGKGGAARVALLNYGAWQARFGGDQNILGRKLTLNNEPVTVVGVLPKGFVFSRGVELWLNPHNRVPEVFPNFSGDHLTMRGMHYMPVLGRLKPGVSLTQAQADINTIVARLQKAYTSNANHGVHLVPMHEYVSGQARTPLLVLCAAVGFVLLIACANVANLLLARATSREREIAVRAALGAGRWRIARQLLTENIVLAIVGGAAGLLLAWWSVGALVQASPEDLPRVNEIGIDRVVLGFTLAVSVLTGLVFGLFPALQVSNPQLNEVLKEGGRSGSGGARRHWLRGALVVGEVAISLVLLIGAGLLARSFVRLLDVKPGFHPENLTTMWLSFSGQKYSKAGTMAQVTEQLIARIEAMPGIQGVAASNDLPLEGQDTNGDPTIEGAPPAPPGQEIMVGQHLANPGFFRAMGIPLLQGRELSARDVSGVPSVAVVNDAMAQKFWPGQNPIGKKFRLMHREGWEEVVGVVGNVKHNGLGQPTSLDVYEPVSQNPWGYLCLIIRTSGDRGALIAAVRREAQALDPDLPVHGVRPMEQVIAETVSSRKLTLTLIGVFASVALQLAAVGIYGVMAYAVTQRTHEIGIRMALGARREDVLKLILGQGMALTLGGVFLGLAGSYGLTRLMTSLLFSTSASDPGTFAGVSVFLIAVALLACYIPARRALRVNPIIALRYE